MTNQLRFAAAMLALSVTAGAAHAEEGMWSHEATKISIDRVIGDMRLGDERDLSDGKKLDLILQFGDATVGEPVTLYLYRSTFPNPALWFERTTAAMQVNMGGLGTDWTPSLFTLGNAPTPNGMRMIISLPAGARFKTTGVAMAQVGQWMMKFRVTSTSLDREGVAKRLDRLIAAVHFASPVPAPHPLTLPTNCESDGFDGGRIIPEGSETDLAQAAVEGLGVMAVAHGLGGLAAVPSEWCRASTNLPPAIAALYRRRTGPGEWVILFGDAGRSIVGHSFTFVPKDNKLKTKAAVYANRLDATHVVALYDDVPYADAAARSAASVVMGQSSGLLTISMDEKDVGAPKKAQ